MDSFTSYPLWLQGLIGCWMFMLFVLYCTFLIIGFNKKRRISSPIRNIILFAVAIIIYFLYQAESSLRHDMHTGLVRYVILFERIPMLTVVGVCLLFTALLSIWVLYSQKWDKRHITDSSIKEAIDTLPAGICIFEDTGRILLKNASMEHVYELMTGKNLLNGCELDEMIRVLPSEVANRGRTISTLSDRSTWSFVKKELKSGKTTLISIKAFDITEEYDKTILLKERQKALSSLNEQLVTYNKNIISTISAQEILNAKVKIHDEMGETLLMIRHYLTADGTEEEKEIIQQKLSRNISFLRKETDTVHQDEYELMIGTAKALGVDVLISGTLPQTEPAKHVVATGIHECFTNTLRHAKGDTLKLDLVTRDGRLEACFSNNGNRPEAVVIEKGGLSSLRSLAEQSGGTMEIVSSPEFMIKITLPLEDNNGL